MYAQRRPALLMGMTRNDEETVWVWRPGFGWVERPAHPVPVELAA